MRSAHMERASKLIRGLPLPGEGLTGEEIACAAWGGAVGKKIAAHTRATRMVRKRLVIEVEDRIWQRQLFTLTPQILAILEKNIGRGVVEDLEFRIVPRRREAQRAMTATAAAPGADEAESIEDPVLRLIYRASRKKALA